MIRRLALACLVALSPALAHAQFAAIGATPPVADNGDRLATTAWVNNFFASGLPLANGKVWIGSAGGIAVAQTMSGNCTLVASGVITCTPPIGNITGLGTGVATALGVNIGTAGAFVANGGALGTPSSGTGTNLTGIPTTALTGALQAAQEPAHTGDVTNSAGSLALAYANVVPAAKGGAGTITGALKGNGAGTVSQAACADLSNATTYCSATLGQLPGTATNDNASAGNIGQYISSSIASGSAVSLTTAVAANVTSVSLTAGDWECSGNVSFSPNAATSVTFEGGWTSTTTATFPTLPNGGSYAAYVGAANIALGSTFSLAPARYSLSGTTTVFLEAQSTFTVNTNAAFGFIGCLRVR